MTKIGSGFRSILAPLSFGGTMLLTGCASQSMQAHQPAIALAPDASEACLSSTNDQIQSFIDVSMGSIAAIRNAIASCQSKPVVPPPTQPCPPGTDPGYCGGSLQPTGSGADANTKAVYNNWLGFVSGSIRIYAPVPPRSGLHPPYEGMGDAYGPIAAAAQTLGQQAQACRPQRGGSPGGPFYPPGSNPCGHDVLCMQNQAQAGSFLNVGEDLFIRFRGCSADIRNSAADYLTSKYSWQ